MLLALIQSTWTTAAEQTPERARADIARAEHIVEDLLGEAPAFAELVADREIEYHTIDDYEARSGWRSFAATGLHGRVRPITHTQTDSPLRGHSGTLAQAVFSCSRARSASAPLLPVSSIVV